MTIEVTEQDIREGFADVRFGRPLSRIIAGARRRRTRKRAAFGAFPAAAMIAAGGTALFRTDKVWAGNVTCYDTADPKALPFGSHSPRTTGESPEELCAKEWRAGYLPFENLDRSDAPYPVPPLTACVAGRPDEKFAVEGAWIGVFPTADPDFCTAGPVSRRMHLAAVPGDYSEHVDRFVAMSNDAADRLRDAAVAEGGSESEACLNAEDAQTLAVEVLADHGYEDWTIKAPRTHNRNDEACWMHINFDNTRKEVTFYSSPQRGIDQIWINDAGVFPKG
jgi:hypothetical protein